MGGLSIVKSLAEYQFPEGEPAYTQTVLDRLHSYELEHSQDKTVKPLALQRIIKKNPAIAKGLEDLKKAK